MVQIKFKQLILNAWAVALVGLIVSCVDSDKDFYNSDYNKNTLSPVIKDFGFVTRGDVKLSVNYGLPGFKTLIEVYDEEPLDDSKNLKENILPIYSAYTDENGKLEKIMDVSTAVKKAYLYTRLIGLPDESVELTATADGFVYDATTKVSKTRAAGTRDDSYVDTSTFPYKLKGSGGVSRNDKVYSITNWDANGEPSGSQLSTTSKVGDEPIGTVSGRVTNFLLAADGSNKKYLRDPEEINIKTTQDGTKISVTFMEGKGEFYNSFGYYYYKTDSPVSSDVPTFYKESFYGMNKYLIFSNASYRYRLGTKPGTTAKLLYFDELGVGHEEFPAGYTVGWFLISDGFLKNSYVNMITETTDISYRNVCTSNDTGNYRQFITVYDDKSKLRVVGIEDSLYPKYSGDDYRDLTFFVSVTPDPGPGDLEPIPDPEKPESSTLAKSGTLAFEDNWPKRGDYDLNDVAIEYKREATFNGSNKITTLTETFKFVQRSGAAIFDDRFAYQVSKMGNVTSSDGCIVEAETGSIIINGTSKNNINKTFTITRTFDGSVDKDDILKDFNPYIIVGDISNNRTEVHLPNAKPTSKADSNKAFTGADAWYMDVNGQYPFAIDIPKTGFNLSEEKTPIDTSYPKFKTWVSSGGKEDTDWYK